MVHNVMRTERGHSIFQLIAAACLWLSAASAFGLGEAEDRTSTLQGLLHNAETTSQSHGTDSPEFRRAALDLMALAQSAPVNRPVLKRAIALLLESLRMDLRAGVEIAPLLQLGKMQFEDGEFELALQSVQRANRRIRLVLAHDPAAAQNWPEVQWLSAAERMAADSQRLLDQSPQGADVDNAALRIEAAARFVDYVHREVLVQMVAGQLDEAQRMLVRTANVLAMRRAAGPGAHAILDLLHAELAAMRGNTAADDAAWSALEAQARALTDSQRREFAERARLTAWVWMLPVLESLANNSHDHRRVQRAKRVALLVENLLQGLLAPQHPRLRLARFQSSAWQMLTLDFADARSRVEELLVTSAEPATTADGDAALRAACLQMLSMDLALGGQHDAAIVLGKSAFNAFRDLPVAAFDIADDNCAEAMCLDPQQVSSAGQRWAHVWITQLLVRQGRLAEAQQLLEMLRERELTDTLRAAGTDFRTARATLTGLEQRRFGRFYQLREQQAALAAERAALTSVAATRALSAAESARLRFIDREAAPELQRAMLQFLRTLDQTMALAPDSRVVQNDTSVVAEAGRLQRTVDQLARDEPQAHAVGVQYLVGSDELTIILTVPGAAPIARQMPIDRAALYESIRAAQVLVGHPQSAPGQLQPALRQLHDLLVAPIAADLRTLGARTLMLSLDDRLRRIPFAALVGPQGRYLLEGYAVALYNEGASRTLPQAGTRAWRVAAMGVSAPVAQLPPLLAVPGELTRVVQAASAGGRTYLNAQFNRLSLEQALGAQPGARYNVLHLASHFVLAAGQPGASALYLGDGSKLSLADLARRPLDFTGLELVVYSACETGVAGGRDGDGLEMESLSALTQRQGAKAVLGTLWKVSDGSVALAMGAFYERRARDGTNLAQALRDAQLALMRGQAGAGNGRYSHPFHWAGFVLMGNWR